MLIGVRSAMTDEETVDLLAASRVIYDVMCNRAATFCDDHGLVFAEDGARVLVVMLETIGFGVVANHVQAKYHTDVINSIAGGLHAGLRAWRQEHPERPVKFDA